MVGASSRPSSSVGVVGSHSSALSWNPEAFNTLYHFVKCSQLEYVGQEGRAPIQELIYERPYMVLPPLMEWVRSGQLLNLYLFFFFCKKSLVCLQGKSMTRSLGKHFSLSFLPATPSSLSRTLEGLFELTRRPSRALDSPRALPPELQRYKDTVRYAAPR